MMAIISSCSLQRKKMVEEILFAHSVLVKVFLIFVLAGVALVVPLYKDKPLAFRKASFIYTMTFQAIATMVAFTGVVAIFAGDLGWSPSTIIMIAVWASLMYIEIKKYKLIKKNNVQNQSAFDLMKSLFVKIGLLQLLLIAVVVALKIVEAKGLIKLN